MIVSSSSRIYKSNIAVVLGEHFIINIVRLGLGIIIKWTNKQTILHNTIFMLIYFFIIIYYIIWTEKYFYNTYNFTNRLYNIQLWYCLQHRVTELQSTKTIITANIIENNENGIFILINVKTCNIIILIYTYKRIQWYLSKESWVIRSIVIFKYPANIYFYF